MMVVRSLVAGILPLNVKLAAFCSVVSGFSIGFAFLFSNFFFLAWVGFVPLLVALANRNIRQIYFLSLLSGICCVAVSSYWIDDFIFYLKGYEPPLRYFLTFCFWFFSAHIFVVLSLLFKILESHSRCSPFVIFPAVLCLVFAFYPLIFSVQLGGSQSQFLIALQGLEITGVYGLDFVIGLSNAVCYQILTRTKVSSLSYGFALCSLSAWFLFGAYALYVGDSEDATSPLLRVGMIQINETPSITVPPPRPGFSQAYPIEMALSESLVDAGVDVIIWPEARHRGYFSQQHVAKAFKRYARDFAVPIIIQDNETEINQGKVTRFNTSVMLDDNGVEHAKYRKIQRIAVGEYLPILNNNHSAKQLLRDLLGDFFSDLEAGEQSVAYHIDSPVQTTLIPLICYELIFPRFVAQAVPDLSGPAVLVGQSNNGWFGDTRQPIQHLNASVLRSVENRLPLVHVVNNGPSMVALPSGRILAQTPSREAGAYAVKLPLITHRDKTFFGRYPYAFVSVIALIFFVVVIDSLRGAHRRKFSEA